MTGFMMLKMIWFKFLFGRLELNQNRRIYPSDLSLNSSLGDWSAGLCYNIH